MDSQRLLRVVYDSGKAGFEEGVTLTSHLIQIIPNLGSSSGSKDALAVVAFYAAPVLIGTTLGLTYGIIKVTPDALQALTGSLGADELVLIAVQNYTYDDRSRLVQIKVFAPTQPESVLSVLSYTYLADSLTPASVVHRDGSGNIVSEKHF